MRIAQETRKLSACSMAPDSIITTVCCLEVANNSNSNRNNSNNNSNNTNNFNNVLDAMLHGRAP